MPIDFKPTKTGGIDFQPTIEKPAEKKPGFFKQLGRTLVEPIVKSLARPVQLAETLGMPEREPTKEVTLPLLGKFDITPPGFGERAEETFGETIKKEAGTAAKTISLGLGATKGAAAFFGGEAAEKGVPAGKIATETIKGAVFGKTADVGFRVLGGVLKTTGEKLLQPFRKSFKPEVAEVAARRGIEVPISAKTESRFVRSLEATTRGGSFGQKTEQIINKARSDIFRITEGLKKEVDVDKIIDTTKTAESAGQAMQRSFSQAKNAFEKARSQVYESVTPRIKDNPAILTNTQKALSEIIARKSASLDPTTKAQVKFYQSILNSTRTATKRTFEAVKQTRTDIGYKLRNRLDPITTGDKAGLERLYAALSDDLDLTASQFDETAGEALRAANEFNKAGMQRINSVIGRTIFRSKSPERLVDQVIRPKQVSEVRALKEVVGDDAFGEIRGSFLNNFIDKSTNKLSGKINPSLLRGNITKYGDDTLTEVLGPEGMTTIRELQKKVVLNDIIEKSQINGAIAPAKLNMMMGKYGDDALKEIIDPADLKALQDVRILSRALGAGQKIAEGSPTAEKMNVLLNIWATATGHIPQLMAKLGAEFGLSRLITSKLGQKYLTEGFGKIKPLTGAGTVISQVPKFLREAPKKPLENILRLGRKTIPQKDVPINTSKTGGTQTLRYSEKIVPAVTQDTTKVKTSVRRYTNKPEAFGAVAKLQPLTQETRKFLEDWTYKSAKKSPQITPKIEQQLKQYKPTEPVILYRAQKVSEKIDRPTSWTYRKDMAKAMIGEPIEEFGPRRVGWEVISKTIYPDEILVDFTKLPNAKDYLNEVIVK